MKTVQLICWSRTSYDTRNTASSTMSFTLSDDCKMSPAKAAKLLDEHGKYAIGRELSGVLIPSARNRTGESPAIGHGVTVVYPSGRTRKYRGD